MRYNRTAHPGSLSTRGMYHYGMVTCDGQHMVDYAVRRTGDRSQARRYWFTWAWSPDKVVATPEENPNP